jgi:hypothetical protein
MDMDSLENIIEVINVLKKYEIISIDQLNNILKIRFKNNETLKEKYKNNEEFREHKKRIARENINHKYKTNEEFREQQKEKAMKRYYEKKHTLNI